MRKGDLAKITKLYPIDILNDIKLNQIGLITKKKRNVFMISIGKIEYEMFENQLEVIK